VCAPYIFVFSWELMDLLGTHSSCECVLCVTCVTSVAGIVGSVFIWLYVSIVRLDAGVYQSWYFPALIMDTTGGPDS
jgi:hypothetical protein